MTKTYQFDSKILCIHDEEIGIAIEKEYNLPNLPSDLSQSQSNVFVERYADQKVLEAYLVEAGQMHGEYIKYFPNGEKSCEAFYNHGKLVGASRYFSEAGVVISETWYVDGVKEGRCQQFYANGSLYSVQKYKHGKYDGQQNFYYDNGDLKSTMHYLNDQLDGSVKLYYPGNTLKREIHYEAGKRVGWECEYDEAGVKRYEVLHPEQEMVRSWHAGGAIAEERSLVKDIQLKKASGEPQKVFVSKRWRDDGFLYFEEEYIKEQEMILRKQYSPEEGKSGLLEQYKWREGAFYKV
jgi:antitoxin component YwqK of YwqJK toxin-antitoxin module